MRIGPPRPRRAANEAPMGEWLGIVIVMVVWLVLQSFVLPRLGVPT